MRPTTWHASLPRSHDRRYNAFVLKYRVGSGGTVATEDLAAAVSYIVANAATLGVSPTAYSLWGSSAGARMAASIGSHGLARYGGGDAPKPSAVVMVYTGHSDYASVETPTFVVVGEEDGIAPPATMKRRVEALRRSGTKVEYREVQGHWARLRARRRDCSRGMDFRSHPILGDFAARAAVEALAKGYLTLFSL